jgi:hypothetical protein
MVNVSRYIRPVNLEEILDSKKKKPVRVYPLWPHKFVSASQSWLVIAAQASKKSPWTVMTGLALWQQYRFNQRRQPLKLTGPMLRSWGIKKIYARRALKALEKAGLVSVQRFKHRSSLITLATGKPDKQGENRGEAS